MFVQAEIEGIRVRRYRNACTTRVALRTDDDIVYVVDSLDRLSFDFEESTSCAGSVR